MEGYFVSIGIQAVNHLFKFIKPDKLPVYPLFSEAGGAEGTPQVAEIPRVYDDEIGIAPYPGAAHHPLNFHGREIEELSRSGVMGQGQEVAP